MADEVERNVSEDAEDVEGQGLRTRASRVGDGAPSEDVGRGPNRNSVSDSDEDVEGQSMFIRNRAS